MKLKHYLQGFGVGVLLTTIVLSISFSIRSSHAAQMTDEEVIARARILGMEMRTPSQTESVPETVAEKPTEEITTEPESSTQESTTEQEESTTEETETQPPTEEPTTQPPTEAPTQPATQPPTEAPTQAETQPPETQVQTEPQPVRIEIEKGMTSKSVSKMLEDKGIIDNAAEFNTYLMENQKHKIIRAGVYRIWPGVSYEEIMNMICLSEEERAAQ